MRSENSETTGQDKHQKIKEHLFLQNFKVYFFKKKLNNSKKSRLNLTVMKQSCTSEESRWELIVR